MSKTFRHEVLIRESHLDTFGHVNNATYFQLLEEARWEAITPGGYGLHDVQRLKQGPVILDAQIKFLKELRLREKVTIVSEPGGYEGKVGKIVQKVLKENGDLAAEASFTVGFFDLATRRLIEPTPAWLRAIGQL